MFGTAVSTSGAVLGAADTQLASVPVQPEFDRTALAWNGTHFLVAYLGTRQVPNGAPISGISGSLIAPDLSIAPTRSALPACRTMSFRRRRCGTARGIS